MALHHSYTLLAPIYDFLVAAGTRHARAQSLAQLGEVSGRTILVDGIGSGLDIPYLPPGAHYVGLDRTPAMLARAAARAPAHLSLVLGDALRLPHADAVFDAVIMHLIVAVVPRPAHALGEAARVLKPGGRILIYDKFIKPGQAAPVRRLLSLVLRHIATRTDVVFETLLATQPSLTVVSDRPALASGWFRYIVLEKR